LNRSVDALASLLWAELDSEPINDSFLMCKTVHLSSLLLKIMSTTLSKPPLSGTDITNIWISYLKHRNEYEEDATAIDLGEFDFMLDEIHDLLKHVQYQDEIIAAQSREVFRKT
jgi:hypothetical protein